MSGPSDFQPTNPALKWIERRLPIMGLMHSSFVAYPTPRNLNYWWTFGAILSMMLGVQILTGVILAMHYTPHADLAFKSVELIVRDVNYGWLLRNMHACGASMFFFAVYIHMFRGLYYGSYKEPREVLWILGVIIYLLMMATGFMGYVLPWGQMSFWGATVITNLFSAVPYFGESIVTLLWGGYSVGNPTLNRFFSLHYLLPFVIAGVVVLHVWALHVAGQNNPAGVEAKTEKDTRAVHALRDHQGRVRRLLLPAVLRLVHLLHAELSRRRRQLHPGQSRRDARRTSCRNGTTCRSTRSCARSRTSSPASSRCSARSSCWRSCPGSTPPRRARRSTVRWPSSSSGSSSWSASVLGYLGAQPPEGIYVIVGRILTFCYFAYFLIVLPLLSPDREAASGAEFDRRRRAGEVRRQGCADGVDRDRADGRRRPVRWAAPERARADDHGTNAAGAEVVVLRPRGQVRSRRAAARPEGLQGSLLGLPRPVLRRVPQPRRTPVVPAIRWRRLQRSPPNTRSRTARTTRARCSSGRAGPPTISRRRSRTSRRRAWPMAAPIRRTCR